MYAAQEAQDPDTAVVNPGRLTQVLNFLTEVGRRVGISAMENVPPISILLFKHYKELLFTYNNCLMKY